MNDGCVDTSDHNVDTSDDGGDVSDCNIDVTASPFCIIKPSRAFYDNTLIFVLMLIFRSTTTVHSLTSVC